MPLCSFLFPFVFIFTVTLERVTNNNWIHDIGIAREASAYVPYFYCEGERPE